MGADGKDIVAKFIYFHTYDRFLARQPIKGHVTVKVVSLTSSHRYVPIKKFHGDVIKIYWVKVTTCATVIKENSILQ